MSNLDKNFLFSMSVAPFWHCGRTIRGNSIHTGIALVLVIAMALWHWGISVIGVVGLSAFVALLTEEFWNKVMERHSTWNDGTALVSGVLLACLLPATAPFWLVIIAAFCAITFGKMAFGGYGANPVSTVCVGWAMVFVSFPIYMDPNAMLLQTDFIDPLVRLKYFGPDFMEHSVSFTDLLLGKQIGALGASQNLAVILGGVYLLARGVIRMEVVISFIAGILLLGGILNICSPEQYVNPFYHLLTGTTLFCAFFLATDFACTPDRSIGMWLYGLIGGMLVVVIRTYGIYTDGAPFAVMLINLLSPYFAMIQPKPFGVKQ